MIHLNTPETFWMNVDVRGPDECWPWKLSCNPKGYGVAKYRGRSWRANRLAWTLTHGPIPQGMLSCHHCDNPPCCNPNGTEHLFLGTPKDNSDDMLAKDRAARGDRHPSRLLPGYLPVGDGHHARKTPEVMARGERNGASVLTEELVREILRRHAVGDSIYRMAKEYQVSKGTVRFVVQRKTWRHVDYPGGVAFRMSETSAHTLIVEATK